jgi:hypothetical protein
MQQRALESLRVFEILHDYHPVLAGTIPLDIDIPGSDLDIICEVHNLDEFERVVRVAFGQYAGFRVARESVRGVLSIIVNFDYAGFPIEIFGQPKPVTEQNAYRHMLVEERLLAIGGEAARETIRALKLAGEKTEPAFARYFNLPGDPYAVLLELSFLNDDELRQRVSKK